MHCLEKEVAEDPLDKLPMLSDRVIDRGRLLLQRANI